MRDLGVLGGNLLDVPDEELIPGSVVAGIPAILLVTGEDLLRSDAVILPDPELITGALEVFLDSGVVPDDDLLAGDYHLDGDVGDAAALMALLKFLSFRTSKYCHITVRYLMPAAFRTAART